MNFNYRTFGILAIIVAVLVATLLSISPYGRWGYFPFELAAIAVILILMLRSLARDQA